MSAASDQIPTYYFKAKQIIPALPPLLVGPDLPPGSADAEARLDPRTVAGSALIAARVDYPSPFLTPAQQAIEIENTLNHEAGHPWDTLLTLQGRNHHALYWTDFRKFPGTWEQAQAAADAQGLAGWQYQPRESWAECFGAAMSGKWTKPEKTMNWGKTVDAMAARVFFQQIAGVAPQPTPPPMTHTIEWLGPVPITNYYAGRDGNPVALIVDHWMAAAFDSALAHFMSPTAGVSAHYLISKFGRIVQVVRDEDTAYHSGNFPVNQLSIGIEHEASPTQLPTDALYAASAWLHHKLSLDYGIRLVVGETVKPHNAIVATQCPGTLDLDRIVREAGGEDDMFTDIDRAKLDKIYARMEVEESRIWSQRLQDWLSKALKSVPGYARATDFTGPDVTTNNPRT